MRDAKVIKGARLRKSELVDCASVGEDCLVAVHIVWRAKLPVGCTGIAASDAVAVTKPGPPDGITDGDICCRRRKRETILPTATSKTWPVPDGIPLTTVRPFRSTTWMMWASVCFSSAIIMGFSPDAVCDEKGSVNIAASQNVSGTTALDRFMVLLLVLCVSVCGFP